MARTTQRPQLPPLPTSAFEYRRVDPLRGLRRQGMAALTAQALTNVLLIVILIRLFTMGRGW